MPGRSASRRSARRSAWPAAPPCVGCCGCCPNSASWPRQVSMGAERSPADVVMNDRRRMGKGEEGSGKRVQGRGVRATDLVGCTMTLGLWVCPVKSAVRTLPPFVLFAGRRSLASIPGYWLLIQVDMHLLHLEVFIHAPHAKLAANAALLVAAPRRLYERWLHVIHPHDAGS